MAIRSVFEGSAPLLFGAMSRWLGGGELGLMRTTHVSARCGDRGRLDGSDIPRAEAGKKRRSTTGCAAIAHLETVQYQICGRLYKRG